ncbi:MAG: hypothetical protein ACK53Y_12940 [bacterium]
MIRDGQRASVSPHSGGLLLRHVGFPCPHALGGLPLAGRVGFPLLGCSRCLELVGGVGFPLPDFPGSHNIHRLPVLQDVCAVALHPPVLPRPYHAAGVSLAPSYL